MKTLNNISSSQYADSVMAKIDENFDDVKSAIDSLEQTGGGPGGSQEDSGKGYINVLCLGNSFTQCTMRYLEGICENLNVKSKVNVQYIYNAGTSLQYYAEQLGTEDSHNLQSAVNGGHLFTGSGTLATLLSKAWDIVVLQQVSGSSDEYATYEPYLSQLIEYIQGHCANKSVKIAFLMTWSTGAAAYADIVSAVKQMNSESGHIVETIIPAGTALANIRGTSMNENNSAYGFTYDKGMHLHVGVGDYVAGCAFYESLLYPFTAKSIRECTLLVDVTQNPDLYDVTRWENVYTGSSAGAVSVTNSNLQTCIMSAVYAYIHPFGALDIDSILGTSNNS